ncbi:general transcription factor IIF subunit 1-like [Leptopilina heterotoma]|uniref:general transcription factor IIF subunit 1-like n=1 Tax=Leptopilina heterotoma TaxID=63436 RepID=UPI001CA7D858|nr:general transcription factor IIF subunit 1-like [Leptopilina heterotoma]
MNAPKPAVGPAQEFSIRVPKNTKKRHNVMRFTSTLNVDFTKWAQVKMERENNLREYKGQDEDAPKFGAGSEFGRDAREEARKKKYGIISRKYKPEDQPWILKAGGKTGKKFRGIKEGGISQYASYYIFTHAQDGAIEAFPLNEWFNFQPIQRYKTLSAEEAEAEFAHRNNVVNYFSLMIRKKLKNDEEGEDDEDMKEDGKGKKGNKKSKEFMISEMDEWMVSDDDSSNSDDDEDKKNSDEDDGKKGSKKSKKIDAKKKKKKKDDFEDDDHAFEESDDGDEEGRECDYMSESSESGSDLEEKKEIKSVAEEDALRKLLVSDEEDDDEDEKEKKDDDDDKHEEDGNKEADKEKDKSGKDGEKRKDKKKKKKSVQKKDVKKSTTGKDSSSDFSSESDSDSDVPKEKEKDKKANSAHSSRSTTPTPAASTSDLMKRKINASPDLSQTKKMKLDNYTSVPTPFTPSSSESGITEEAVRRYLMRKPMTTTELLQKFKSKKTGLTSEQLVNTMTGILKRINPTKQTIKNKMYLFIKSQPN